MVEVSLIYPPSITSEKKFISELAEEAYKYWTLYLENKFLDSLGIPRTFFSTREHPMSLGLLCLSSYLKERDIKVKYIHSDYLLYKKNFNYGSCLDYIEKQVKSSDVCGIYSTTPTFSHALKIIKGVKERNPEIITVMGGPHASFTDTEIIKKYSFIDFVVRGEGEQTFYEIVKRIDNLNNESQILGATYRINGRIMRCLDRPLLPEDEIPNPDYDVLPHDFDILMYDMYSRGCPFNCYYCVENKLLGKNVRFRNPYTIVNELNFIREKFKKRFIHIADSEIDISSKKLNSLINAIKKYDIDGYFSVNMRPDAYKRIDLSTLKKMNEVGFVEYFIGIESGSDYMLKKMNKGCAYSDFIATLELLNKSGAKMIVPYVMLGFPGETVNTIKETQFKFIKLLKENKVSFFSPKLFIPYPGTLPFEFPELFNIILSYDYDKYERFTFPPPYTSKYLDNENFKKLIAEFYNNIIKTLKEKVA